MAEKKRPLIIDCDPGIDDAECLLMLQGCGLFDILGIIPVHGNVPLAKTSVNALYLNNKYGINTKVIKGADQAIIVRNPRAEFAHGKTGLANMEINTDGLSFTDGYAWDFIWEKAKEYNGELELIAVGPLTDIAITVLKHPDIVKLVKRLVIMGGATTAGNASAYAEFNIHQDPHAAKIVFEAGFNLTMVGLECCYTGYLDRNDKQKVIDTAKKTSVGDLIEAFARFDEENIANWSVSEELKKNFYEHKVLCDAIAAAVCIDENIAKYMDLNVIVDVDGKLTMGQTVVDWFGFSGKPNVHVAMSVDRERFVNMYLDCIRSYGKEGA